MSVMPCIVFGQNTKYSYDNAGNRIKKEIVMNTRAISKEESSKECYSYMLLERNIRIYPNPTQGKLKLEIMGYMSSDQCAVCVVNASGQQILSTPITSSWTEVDINAQPNGIYILHVSLNNKETTWKIIKK